MNDYLIVYMLPISICFAYILDLIFGDPYWFPHPVIFIGKLISKLEKSVRKNIFFEKNDINMKIGGLFISIVTIIVTSSIVYFVCNIFSFNIYINIFIYSFILYTCFSTKCLGDEAKKVYMKLEILNKNNLNRDNNIDLGSARKQLSNIVGRDTSQLSEDEIIRATVETVAENTVDGTIAPMFYAFIGGPVFAMGYKAVNTMDSMLGYKNKKYLNIGMFPAKIDDMFNFIPARISLITFGIASFILGYNWKKSILIGFRDRKNHKSPNCAFPEGAVAGALGIQLGGSNVYFGEKVYKPTIGDKTRDIDKEDIIKSIKLMYVSTFISILIFIILYIFLHNNFII